MDKSGSTAAQLAANSSTSLMKSLSKLGLSALGPTLDYARKGLAQKDLPEYVQRGYRGAKTAALEGAAAEGRAVRRQGLQGAPLETVPGRAGTFSGAAAAYAKEAAGIEASKAMGTISQRNQLLNVMAGTGAGAVNLGGGFGSLTNRALVSGLDAGNPTYEAVTGSLAAGMPLLLTALQRTQSPLASGGGSSAGMAGANFFD